MIGDMSSKKMNLIDLLKWRAQRDSNPQHFDLESNALPLELYALKKQKKGPIRYS
jgi:hypothetical protein